MTRRLRSYDDSGYLHIVLRGNAQQIVFLDDMDRRKFIKELNKYSVEMSIDILAYCLMDNHVHIIVHDSRLDFSEFMKKVEIAYVRYFNVKYERCGHLFQDRFYSKSIMNDLQMLYAVRYVHLNPQEAGICRFDQYEWSSYNEYLSGRYYCNTTFVLELSGGIENFKEIHRLDDNYYFEGPNISIKDSEARLIITGILGHCNYSLLKEADKDIRNALIAEMKHQGLSVRQISRITGISKGIVQRS